jgi:hypothetical protein
MLNKPNSTSNKIQNERNGTRQKCFVPFSMGELMKIKTRQSGRTIKRSDRADNLAQKTKSGLSDSNRAAEQLQDANAESGVDYAGSRVQEGEGQIGEYATYGMERIGCWGIRVTSNELRRIYRRSRRVVRSIDPRLPRQRLPMPYHKRLPPAKKMLNAPRQTARGSMNASQKAMRILKKNFQNTVRYTKTILRSITATIKAGIVAIKGTVALVIAGGAIAVIVIVIICMAAIVGGKLTGNL